MIEEQRRSGVPYLHATLLPAQGDEILELDEMWSFVGSKKNKVWLWLALCRRTRQVVGYPLGGWYGPRHTLSCQTLWQKTPPTYKTGLCYTDLYASYKGVIPGDQHKPCPKQQGQTNHVERFNLTLRQSLARLVRKTLSYSKKLLPHIQAIALFLVHYNKRAAKRYLKSQASITTN